MFDNTDPVIEERTFVARVSGAISATHVEARNCFEAAILYAEMAALEPDEDGAVAITVEEPTGERHCFRIDLDAGEISPC